MALYLHFHWVRRLLPIYNGHYKVTYTPSYLFIVADTTRSVSHHFDVINPDTGLAQRAAFIIDQARQVRFSFVLEDNRILHSMDTICAIVSWEKSVCNVTATMYTKTVFSFL